MQEKVDQLKGLTEDELQAELIKDKPYIPPEETDVEVRVRQIRVVKALTSALEAYTGQAKEASDRLESLTKWLIAFTVALVLLGVAVLFRDLTHGAGYSAAALTAREKPVDQRRDHKLLTSPQTQTKLLNRNQRTAPANYSRRSAGYSPSRVYFFQQQVSRLG